MQGVRTTRGCVNCKKRKKGCSLEKPTCSRCQRLNITCAYEARRYIFVDGSESPPSKSPSPGQLSHSTNSQVGLTGASQGALARTASELQIEAGFWDVFLPHEDAILDGIIGGVLSAPWIPSVRTLAQQDSYVRTAVNACAFAGLGWSREDHSLTRHGARLYAQALKETNKALQDLARVRSDNVLAACRVLGLFEMFRRTPGADDSKKGTQVLDWQKHVNGTCQIIRLRGRDMHIEGRGRSLYDGVRMTAVILGFVQRKPNDFTNLSWTMPLQNNLRDDLYDLVSTVPELFQQTDQLVGSATLLASPTYISEFYARGCETLDWYSSLGSRLREWEDRAVEDCKQRRETVRHDKKLAQAAPNALEEDHTTLRDFCKSYGDGFFFICTQYWVFSLKLYASARLFHRQFSSICSTAQADLGMPPLPPWMSPEPHALNIAQVTEYFFRPGSGLWSAQSAVFPVGNALVYYARTGRRDSPIVKAMTDSFANSRNGSVLRDFLQDIVDAAWLPRS